jgi:hypothetical protein
MRCDVCGEGLPYRDWLDRDKPVGGWYDHRKPMDHAAVPVPSTPEDPDQVSVCDFCESYGPTWEFPAKDFEVNLGLNGSTFRSFGRWLACDACAPDVINAQWVNIVPRFLASQTMAGKPPLMALSTVEFMRRQMWPLFFQHRNGEPFPIGARASR